MQKKNQSLHRLWGFLFLLSLVFLIQYMGAFFTGSSSQQWYYSLNKPSWTPKQEVFTPIWTFLYLIVAAVAYFLWKEKPSSNRKKALFFWGLQLLANGLWSFSFFYFQNITLALWNLGLIVVLVLILFHYAKKVSSMASVLLLPFFLWLLYAFCLNFSIWMQN